MVINVLFNKKDWVWIDRQQVKTKLRKIITLTVDEIIFKTKKRISYFQLVKVLLFWRQEK